MNNEHNLYIQIYKIKSGLEKQLADIQIQLEKAMPKDLNQRNKLANDVIFGKYDYPFDGLALEKVLFVTKKLKKATVTEIKKYMLMIGETNIKENRLELEIKSTLAVLTANDRVLEIGGSKEDSIKYEINN